MFRPLKNAVLTLLLAIPLTAGALERTTLIPGDAQTYVRVSNATNFLAKLKKSSVGRLWADRQFQDFLGNPDAEIWEEILFDGEKTAEDAMYLEQLKMLTGEVIFALDKRRDSYCIIAAISEEDFLRSLVLDEKLAEVGETPFKIIRHVFQGVEMIQHIEAAGTTAEDSSWQAYLKNTLVMGGSREWVEKSIVQLKSIRFDNPQFKIDTTFDRTDFTRLLVERFGEVLELDS